MRVRTPLALEWQPAGIGQEYDTLLERCGAGVLVIDAEGRIRRTNSLGRRLLALHRDADSISSRPIFDEIALALEPDARHAEPMQKELRGPGGSHLIATVSPVLDSTGTHGGFMLILHDVTELRRLEKVRRDFVANVSHEMRTPLASIRAMAETLQDGALADESVASHFLATIINETLRLTRISEDLLGLSDAESRIPERIALDLSDLINKVMARFVPQAEKAGITLDGSVPEGLGVEANPDQIEQVLVNLVDNAIKYTPSGGQVTVTAEMHDGQVAVHVADTGIGIELKHLPRIFERFYRVDKARSRQSGGTGLGLSIVKHIVEAHGGRVNVASEPGCGSTFTFILPGPECAAPGFSLSLFTDS